MIRRKFWSYEDLLDSFGLKKTNKLKVSEYLLYTIGILSDEEIIILRNTAEYIEAPYERYVECVLYSIKNAHLELPKYLEQPLDVNDYNQIVTHVKQIEQLRNELKNCRFKLFAKMKVKNKLNHLLKQKLTVDQVFNYYFLRIADEDGVKADNLDNFVIKLKDELMLFAKNLPVKFTYLNL